jgi:hypothetical protein
MPYAVMFLMPCNYTLANWEIRRGVSENHFKYQEADLYKQVGLLVLNMVDLYPGVVEGVQHL